MSIHIGTSGWHYMHWKGPFYPDGLPARQFLAYYTQYFATAEINNSFYKLPTAETMAAWREAVPDGFLFAVKANRFITHMKKLKDPQEPLRRFYERVELLEDRLGPLLFQLPPRWRFNAERFEGFLRALSPQYRHTFEFRDPTWFNERTYELLQRYGAAFCIYDLAGLTSPLLVTADFVYVRLHGPGGAYQGSYTPEALAAWGEALRGWDERGLPVYCYFDNDEAGYAAHDALQLRSLVSRSPGSPAG